MTEMDLPNSSYIDQSLEVVSKGPQWNVVTLLLNQRLTETITVNNFVWCFILTCIQYFDNFLAFPKVSFTLLICLAEKSSQETYTGPFQSYSEKLMFAIQTSYIFTIHYQKLSSCCPCCRTWAERDYRSDPCHSRFALFHQSNILSLSSSIIQFIWNFVNYLRHEDMQIGSDSITFIELLPLLRPEPCNSSNIFNWIDMILCGYVCHDLKLWMLFEFQLSYFW